MIQILPAFDELAELARTHPEQFEQLRTDVCEAFINEAPEACRPRLRGLQFRIDMERRRCANPMASCIRISAMMHDSLDQLRLALNGGSDCLNGTPAGSGAQRTRAAVVSLEGFREARGRNLTWGQGG